MEETEEKVVEERKEKLKEVFLKKNLWIFIILAILVVFGVYIRYLPLSDHGGHPGLWDTTTNDYTLGPDLDPWVFTRYAKTLIETGSLPKLDMMRNVPLGFDTSIELQMVSYMIVLTYKLLNFFGSYSVNFAAAFMPVILFALTIISFFFFVREIFLKKDSEYDNLKANIIAIISTFFMIVIPVFLSRTVAGIPEKESVAFFFMFLAFFLFLKAWKTEKLKNAIILGVLAGISTGLMGLTWGGASYIYVTIAAAGFFAFSLNKMHRKEALAYDSWIITSMIITLIFASGRISLKGFVTGIDTGMSLLVLILPIVNFIIWNTKISQTKFLRELKIPKNIFSLIVAFILGIILISILAGPSTIIEKIQAIHQTTFKPIIGRWSTTVAENKQPYFTEWGASFGPFIKGIPIMFWLFFIGSIAMFKKMVSSLKRKDSWILTALFILFLLGMIFSRYAPHPSIFDGEGFLSQIFYYGSALLLVLSLIYYFMIYHKEKNDGFEKIDLGVLFLLILFVLCLFTARSAVRLIMVLGPVAPIFACYLAVSSAFEFRKVNDDTKKIIIGVFAIVIALLLLYCAWNYYQEVKSESYNYVPYTYTIQWQKAMAWVRDNTPIDAVFAHWCDYGYWVQSIGNRATVTDGGNAQVWWNYLTGRLVLTGDNQQEALDFLYAHNTSYLLIDSSDLGKYGAFSSIGSDENYDRFSSGSSTMFSDAKTIKETKDSIIRTYYIPAGNNMISIVPIEEDISYDNNGSNIRLIKEKTGLAQINVEYSSAGNATKFIKAEAVFLSSNNQVPLPLRYVYYQGKLTDLGKGLEAAAYIIPRISQTSMDNAGAVIYISPRLFRGMLAQIYLLNDSLGRFPNFKIAHSEESLFVDNLRSQGYPIDEFSYFDNAGLQGPIKIWKIEYTGNERIKPEYLDTDSSKYLSWKL